MNNMKHIKLFSAFTLISFIGLMVVINVRAHTSNLEIEGHNGITYDIC